MTNSVLRKGLKLFARYSSIQIFSVLEIKTRYAPFSEMRKHNRRESRVVEEQSRKTASDLDWEA